MPYYILFDSEVTAAASQTFRLDCPPDCALPCGWSAEPNGINCSNGNNFSYNPSSQTFTGTSTNCYYPNPYTSDELAFAQHELCGNGSITAQVTSITGSLGWAGITMRESNMPGAKKAQLTTNLSNFNRREFRTTTNGSANPHQFLSLNRYWLRITRSGNQFSIEVSPNGVAWFPAGFQNISMASCIEVGLVITNNSVNSTVSATFANVSVIGVIPAPIVNSPDDLLTITDFSIYPNPSSGRVEIDLSSYYYRKVQLELYNLQGKLLRFMTLDVEKDKEEIDLSSFASGMYLIRVSTVGMPDVTKRVVLNSN
ncbi:MAG: T9SS type A sorting domain-containing protein [Saprospiraceae bacterium]|nr:T9SS type A sorting domain-containing protein [Saprospiraceae bacterium]